MKIKIVSLFANVGIAEAYLDNVLLANEIEEKRCKYYEYMYPETKMICGDIKNNNIYNQLLKNAKQYECNFVLATPPCQGMSFAGKRSVTDTRNELIRYAVDFILELDSEYALIENVPAMPSYPIFYNRKQLTIKNYVLNRLSDKYNISFNIFNSADFGVPQIRKRAIILISRKDKKIFQLDKLKKEKHITVKEAIGHLPSLESEEKSDIPYHYAKKHNDNHIFWLKHTPTGQTALDNEVHYPSKNGRKIKGYKTTYKRISWDKPSPTITMANGSVSSQNNVHPGNEIASGIYDNARVLTLKELFILTGLPENYFPPEWASDNFIRRVLGEGIPPLMVLKIIKLLG